MKNFLKIIIPLLLLGTPFMAFATTSVPWSITNLTDGFIFPNLVNGNAKGILVSASSTINGNFSVSTLTSGDCVQASTGGLLVSAVGACGSSSGSAFPFTTTTYGVSTSTIVGFINGLLSTASSTFTSTLTFSNFLSGELAVNSTGGVYKAATTTFSTGLTYTNGAVTVNTSQNISTLSNLTNNGLVLTSGGTGALSIFAGSTCGGGQFANQISASGALTCGTPSGGGGSGNVSTSSAETANQIPYWTSTAATPALLSGGNSGLQYDGTKLVINYASSTALSATSEIYATGGNAVTAVNFALTSTGQTGLYSNSGNAALASGGTGVTWGSLSGTISWYPNTDNVRNLGGSANRWLNLWVSGTGTTTTQYVTGLTQSSLVYADNLGKLVSVATSTLTASSPLTGSFTVVQANGSTGSVGCQTASGSQAGCLSSTDWNTFNNKLGSYNPFTTGSDFGQTVVATTSLNLPLWFQNGIYASTTLIADNATTTNATTTSLALLGAGKNCNGTSALTTTSAGQVSCTAQPQGTVTAVSVVTANGFAGSSSGGATPALTLTTTVTGLLKGNGTAISAAALTDFPTQAAGTVIANGTGNTAVPTAVSTSTLYTGTAGQILAFLSGSWQGTATTTFGTGLSYLNGQVTLPTVTTALGGTNNTAFSGSTLIAANGAGTTLISTSTIAFQAFTATSTTATNNIFGALTISTTTTTALLIRDAFNTNVLSVNTGSTTGAIFSVFATTTPNSVTQCGVANGQCLFSIDQYGHVAASSTVPVLSSCGTSPSLSSDSSDSAGTITVGSVAATACTLTFGSVHTIGTHCVISEQTGSVVNASSYTESLTGFTYSQTGLTSDKLDYICYGQ